MSNDMKINLLRDYCGRIINDAVLLKGEHEVNETVGTYLVGKGYAVDVTPVASEPVAPVVDEATVTEDVVTQERTFTPKPKRK